jgi:hypothetical protein
MAAVGLTFQTGVASTIGTVELDALLSEATDLNAKATEYAVEDDSPISDHIIVESERLKLSGWVTPSSVMQMTADGRPKLLEAKASLRKIMKDRAELTISTGMDTYTGMVMESCAIGRSNEGDHLTVDCEFVKIRKVQLRTVDIPPEKVATGSTAKGKAGSTKTKAGKANPDAGPTGPQKTKLARLADS